MDRALYEKEIKDAIHTVVNEFDDMGFREVEKYLKDRIESKKTVEEKRVLVSILSYMRFEKQKKKVNNILKMLGQQLYPMEEQQNLKYIYRICNKPGASCLLAAHLYNYGFIQGKRAERARRRKETAVKTNAKQAISKQTIDVS